MRIISADDHINPPPTIYAERLPKEFRDRAPRVEMRGDSEVLVFEGTEKPFYALQGEAGVKDEDVVTLSKTKEAGRKGGWDPTRASRTWTSTESTPRCSSGAATAAASRSSARTAPSASP